MRVGDDVNSIRNISFIPRSECRKLVFKEVHIDLGLNNYVFEGVVSNLRVLFI